MFSFRDSAAEETRFLSREEYQRILPSQDDRVLMDLIRRIVNQTSNRFSRQFSISLPNLEIVSYSDPDAHAMVERFRRIPANVFVSGNKILVNLGSDEIQHSIQDVIVHELAHKLYDQRGGELSVDIDNEEFADIIVKGFSRDPGQPFNASTAPKQYHLFQQIMKDLKENSMVTVYLDRIASTLESRGYLREAEEIDILSNTIEKTAFKFPDFGRSRRDQDTEELRRFIGDRVKGNPAFLANKAEFLDPIKGDILGEERFRTRRQPKVFKDKFVQGPDGYWYLQDVESLSVHQYPDKMVLYDDSRDKSEPIEGLEVVGPFQQRESLLQPLRSRRDYGQ